MGFLEPNLMSIVNGTKIVAPVGVEDVRRILGVSSTDVKTLCTSPKINKYSRYKPYAIGSYATLTDEELSAANYGMIPKYIKFVDYVATDLGIMPWGQTPGIGTANFGRLSDFDRYDHTSAKSINGVRIYSTAGTSYTTPIYTDGTQRREGLIGEVDIQLTTGLIFEDFSMSIGSERQKIGDYYLTLVLTSLDIGGGMFWVAQDERTIKEYNGRKAMVTMYTTDIPRDDLDNLGPNFVAVGLCPKLTISDDYTIPNSGTIPSLVSLDIWADGFTHMVYNQDTVMAGTGGAGGNPIVHYVYFVGRFAYTPPLRFNFTVRSDGTTLVSIEGRTAALVTWTSFPDNSDLVTAGTQLLVDVSIKDSSHPEVKSTFEVPLERDSDQLYCLDGASFLINTPNLQGEATATVRFYLDSSNIGNGYVYHFMDADNQEHVLESTSNVTINY